MTAVSPFVTPEQEAIPASRRMYASSSTPIVCMS